MRGQASLLLALVLVGACAGPGLEPPKEPSQSGGGTGGTGGSAGSGGGLDNPGGGAGGAPPIGGTGMEPSTEQDAANPDDDGSLDGGGDAAIGEDAGVTFESRELVGPSYLGSLFNGAECATSYPTQGHEPVSAAGQKHPLFLYFVGTDFVGGDVSAQHNSPAPLKVTEAMGRRGFVALSAQYDNGAVAWASDHVNQLACMFGGANAQSLIANACALPNVDCELGIATWGHSQGGYVAAMAHNVEPRVRAAWATGYGGDGAATLAKERLRVVNGEADAGDNGTAAKLSMITGMAAGECTDPDQCLRADGSGWIIVRKSALAMPETSTADHCWFDRPSCGASMIVLEPSWIDPASQHAFALELNADWIARAARR